MKLFLDTANIQEIREAVALTDEPALVESYALRVKLVCRELQMVAAAITHYDQQIAEETKQTNSNRIAAPLRAWMDTAFSGALAGDYGPITRTNDARALMAKVDFRLSPRHNLSLKYNYTWSEQENGTFNVDAWARSANGLGRFRTESMKAAHVAAVGSRRNFVMALTTPKFTPCSSPPLPGAV